MTRAARRLASGSDAGGGAQLAEEIFEILGADILVLRQDALERAPAMALAVVLAAVECGLLRDAQPDTHQIEELERQLAALVDRLESQRPGVIDEESGIVNRDVRQHGEGRLDESDVAQADGAHHQIRGESTAAV